MNEELNNAVTVKIVGELIIQRNELEKIFKNEPAKNEFPKLSLPETAGKLPRLAFSMQETAEILGISYATVHRLTQRGLLKTSFACRKKMISKTEIERFLRETSRSAYEP